MHCHSCYRLFAAVDFILAGFTGTLWYIVYSREDDLIRLQFETNVTHNALLPRVPSYAAIIRSIGSSHDDNASVEILTEIYHRVQDSCRPYYKRIGVKNVNLTSELPRKTVAKLKKKAMNILQLGTLIILICIGVFMFVDALIMCSTRDGKASSKIVICLLFNLHLVACILYALAALELRLDPIFCAPEGDLRPMVFVIILTTGVCKPFQIYVNCHYFCDVRKGDYVDEPESDAEIDVEEPELEVTLEPGGKRRSIWVGDQTDDADEEQNQNQDKDPNSNRNSVSVDRKRNATDLTVKV